MATGATIDPEALRIELMDVVDQLIVAAGGEATEETIAQPLDQGLASPLADALRREAVQPAVDRLSSIDASAAQVEGTKRKLAFVTQEATRALLERADAAQMEPESVVRGVLESLCPLWPICE